tara:strand:- start:3840 stop:5381 length:1542 start_codon:yes stop_codon:yes gene_type:complete
VDISEFIGKYKNHPVLFVGAGVSLRYLNNSYTWDSLLKHVAQELTGNPDNYFDIKSECYVSGKYNYSQIATKLETIFNLALSKDRYGKFRDINDIFYQEMEDGGTPNRFKIYLSKLLSELNYREDMAVEISELKKVRKNISSVITTNYDGFIEDVFDFEPLVGNDILLSNPYGSVYKIHGCHTQPAKIIITDSDYNDFNAKYELIRAQLLSLFIHNPVIFMGYNIGDDNIKSLLKTIFTYVEPNSAESERIRSNFLLVEYEANSDSHFITEHDIDLEGFASTIRINKIKTDDFIEIYKSLSNLHLPVSAMDIRKVQDVVKEIYAGGNIMVNITEDLDSLRNGEKILAIGSNKTITYSHQDAARMIKNYFSIIDESNHQLLMLINEIRISKTQWFPIFGFLTICPQLGQAIKDGEVVNSKSEALKKQQVEQLGLHIEKIGNTGSAISEHKLISDIFADESIPKSHKFNAIIWSLWENNLEFGDVRNFLNSVVDKGVTDYRRLLCAYDFKKYGEI